MKIMAVDLGDARTGLAVCDPEEMLASPVAVVQERDPDLLLKRVVAAAMEQWAGEIVVGYPKHMNGTRGERAEKSERFAESLREQVGIPVILWDERSTTVSAIGYLNKTNTRGKKRRAVVDAVAAVIILESYLAFRKRSKGL